MGEIETRIECFDLCLEAGERGGPAGELTPGRVHSPRIRIRRLPTRRRVDVARCATARKVCNQSVAFCLRPNRRHRRAESRVRSEAVSDTALPVEQHRHDSLLEARFELGTFRRFASRRQVVPLSLHGFKRSLQGSLVVGAVGDSGLRVLLCQLPLQCVDELLLLHDLLAILRDMTVDRNDVPDRLGLDLLGAVGVLKRVVRFVVMRARRTDADDHDSLAVPAERLLEQSSELRVAIRNVTAFARIAEGVDAVAERKKRTIDVCAFVQPAGQESASACLSTSAQHHIPFATVLRHTSSF